MTTAQTKAAFWEQDEYFDRETRAQVRRLSAREREDCFAADLNFGTGGVRGQMGVGTNRMNRYVVRKITQGLAEILCEKGAEIRRQGVVIAYDSRKDAAAFALEAALVLCGAGIRVYWFSALRPTPELSFAVRFLHTAAGINITASHNPKEYQGYKVYGADGGQILPHEADQIFRRMQQRTDWKIRMLSVEDAKKQGLLSEIGTQVDAAYCQAILSQSFYTELHSQPKLQVVYTPLHGSGGVLVPAVLQKSGLCEVWVVPEQAAPDAAFPTITRPNPEEPEAFALAKQYAQCRQADLVLATDPDADRLGAYARDERGAYRHLTGNQVGILLLFYLLSRRTELGKLPTDGNVITTIASTGWGAAITRFFGVKLVQVPVGFKYIGEQIRKMEESGQGTFLMGYEESCGYLAGTYTRDKDAVQAALLLCEAACYYRQRWQYTLPQMLNFLSQRFGCWHDEQLALQREGLAGKAEIAAMMNCLRTPTLTELGGMSIRAIEDYLSGIRTRMDTNTTERLILPSMDAIRFLFDAGGFLLARPSGTEPKIKFYLSICGEQPAELAAKGRHIYAELLQLLKVHER